MARLKIGVAGAGMIGRRHVELIQASAQCELVAIADPGAAARDFARTAGVAHFDALADLLRAARPDGVIEATPNALHVPDALACIAAGVPVLIEKPVAHTVVEGERLLAAVDEAQARVLVGHHRRHSTIMEAACAIVAKGTLGPLVGVMGSALFYKPDGYFDAGPWRRQAGGGPVLINMIHEIDNLRALGGEIVAVQACLSNATRGFVVEDTAAINLRFANGALGTFLLSDTAASACSWEQTSREDRRYPTYADEDCYLITGTRGSLAIPTMRLKTYARDEDRSWWKPFVEGVASLERADPLERQLAHFCAVIRGEVEPKVSVRDGLQNLRVCEAIVEAARSGRSVELR